MHRECYAAKICGLDNIKYVVSYVGLLNTDSVDRKKKKKKKFH